MNRTINALCEAGLVYRSRSTDDGRKVLLMATEAGLDLMHETRKRRDAWLAQRVMKLSPDQRRVVAEATVIMKGLASS